MFLRSIALPVISLLLLGADLVYAKNKSAEFLLPPQHIAPPDEVHTANNRAFQGISSMTVSPEGRLWATWYAGVTPGEDANNYIVLATSGDGGTTWKETLVVDPDGPGPVRAFDPEIWVDPKGRLHLFWAQAIGHDGGVSGTWWISTDDPEAETPEWSPASRIGDGIMMCKPTVLESGEWVLPLSTWQTENSAKVVFSKDEGATWEVRGGSTVPKNDRTFDEHMIIERKDGSLWMLVRTRYGIGESVSSDGGFTWTETKPSSIPHPTSRFFISRVESGNLLLVKHGAMDEQTGRSHLRAFTSSDDGTTWQGGLLLDERNGISYPDGQQGVDGTIYITYDFDRTNAREIYYAAFREEDATAGNPVSGKVVSRKLISKASGGQEAPRAVLPEPRAHNDGEPLRTENPGTWDTSAYPLAGLSTGVIVFSDRGYTAAEIPQVISRANFLRMPLEKDKSITCAVDGTLFVLTPDTDRNKDSQSGRLLEQGFKKVQLPEFLLFNPASGANYVTLYQKDCEKGEVITFSQWAVPLVLPRAE